MTSSSRPAPDHDRIRLLADVLAGAGLSAERIEPLPGSYRGDTFRATIRGHDDVVLKVRPNIHALAMARVVASLLANRGLSYRAVVPPTRTAIGWVMGARWIDGDALADVDLRAWRPEEVTRFGGDLGDWLSRLHTVRSFRRDWLSQADRRFTEKLERGAAAGHLTPDLVESLTVVWRRIRPALRSAPVTLIHRDLQPGNIIVRDRRLEAVIDFEQSRLADPLYDLVKPSEWVLPLHHDIAPAFWEAYGADRTRPNIQDRLSAVFILE